MIEMIFNIVLGFVVLMIFGLLIQLIYHLPSSIYKFLIRIEDMSYLLCAMFDSALKEKFNFIYLRYKITMEIFDEGKIIEGMTVDDVINEYLLFLQGLKKINRNYISDLTTEILERGFGAEHISEISADAHQEENDCEAVINSIIEDLKIGSQKENGKHEIRFYSIPYMPTERISLKFSKNILTKKSVDFRSLKWDVKHMLLKSHIRY